MNQSPFVRGGSLDPEITKTRGETEIKFDEREVLVDQKKKHQI